MGACAPSTLFNTRNHIDSMIDGYNKRSHGMHDKGHARILKNDGLGLLWALMTMTRPVGSKHRGKLKRIINGMHKAFTRHVSPAYVVSKYRSALNEIMIQHIKIDWIDNGHRCE